MVPRFPEQRAGARRGRAGIRHWHRAAELPYQRVRL